ncbi:hypothetical protein ACROYT_G028748 [Oculina patagonica]
MKRARGEAAKILVVSWNASAFCLSLFAMNEIESFLAPDSHQTTKDVIGFLPGSPGWQSIHLTGAISGYIIMCKRINLETHTQVLLCLNHHCKLHLKTRQDPKNDKGLLYQNGNNEKTKEEV